MPVSLDLRRLMNRQVVLLREWGESENCLLFDSLSTPSVVWALSPAVEASLHGAASALGITEWSGSSRSPSQNFATLLIANRTPSNKRLPTWENLKNKDVSHFCESI